MRVVHAGKEIAERNGNAPWLFTFREAWFRTVALDFAGARALCDSVTRETTEYSTGQPQTIAKIASAYAQLESGQHAGALQTFAQIVDPATTPRFFLHWYWRMNAQLGLADAWLATRNLQNARTEADRFLDAASSTSEPNLLARAWEAEARVAMAAKDWTGAERNIESALAIVAKFDIPTTAWRVHATRADLSRCMKDGRAAEHHRARAEGLVLALADSFDRDEPLRQVFLSSPPVRRICRGRAGSGRVAPRESKH
jgi:hypothetical protein